MLSDDNSIYVGGYAEFPVGTTHKEFYKYLAVGLKIDPDTGTVLDVASTFLAEMTQDFLRSILIGYNLSNGIDSVVETIKRRYFSKVKKAMIAAVVDAYNNYETYLNEKYKY